MYRLYRFELYRLYPVGIHFQILYPDLYPAGIQFLYPVRILYPGLYPVGIHFHFRGIHFLARGIQMYPVLYPVSLQVVRGARGFLHWVF